MTVKRIVSNTAATDTADAKEFYGDFLGLDIAMDQGWITTYCAPDNRAVQISIATEGGSGTSVPDLSIEVDNIDEVYSLAKSEGLDILYPLTEEPWGVRRFYVRDPYGKVVNILSHSASHKT